jgi:hypothetical protein
LGYRAGTGVGTGARRLSLGGPGQPEPAQTYAEEMNSDARDFFHSTLVYCP